MNEFAMHIPVMIGTLGRYFDTRRAVLPLVDKTIIAEAFCSEAAATAAIATVSTVSVGRGVSARSSSKTTGYAIAASASKQVSAIIKTIEVTFKTLSISQIAVKAYRIEWGMILSRSHQTT